MQDLHAGNSKCEYSKYDLKICDRITDVAPIFEDFEFDVSFLEGSLQIGRQN